MSIECFGPATVTLLGHGGQFEHHGQGAEGQGFEPNSGENPCD